MAAQLTASFVLKLEDKLSGGIQALTKKLDALAKLARTVQMTGLDGAERALDKVGAGAATAGRKLDGMGRAAQGALADLRRLGDEAIRINAAGVARLPPAMARAAMAGTVLAAAALSPGGGGGAHGPLALPRLPAPMSGKPLGLTQQLAAPDASFDGGSGGGFRAGYANGANLNFPSLTAGAARFGNAVRATAGQVQGLSGAMGHLGHAGLTAFATGFGLMHPISEYAEYENTLRHIAITANTPMDQLGATIKGLATQYDHLALASGQSAEKIAESANFLVTTGIGRQAVDSLLPLVAKAATAYNAPIGDSVQAIFSLKENLHVKEEDMAATVSAMALAGKQGHFSFSDMSRFLPDVAPLAANAGLRGTAGARELMTMLETSRRNAGTSGEAATNVRDFLSHLFGSPKRGLGKEFKGYGIDLAKVLLDAEKAGISAPAAVIAQVKKLVEGKSEIEVGLILGRLFHNQQSASYVRGRIADDAYFNRTQEKLQGADANTIPDDFNKAKEAPLVKLRNIEEMQKQIVRRFGEGFTSLLVPIDMVFGHILAGFGWMDEHMPGTLNTVLGWVGGFFGLAAVLGLLVPLFKVLGLGIQLMFGPFKLLFMAIRFLGGLVAAVFGGMSLPVLIAVALIAGAAYLIWRNWAAVSAWFQRLWEAVKMYFRGFYEFLAGVFTGNMGRAKAGLMTMWEGLKAVFSVLWEGIKGTFLAFVAWIDGWTGGAVTAAIAMFKAAWDGLTGFFTDLVAQWAAPFNAFIEGIEAKIAGLRNSAVGVALGLGTPTTLSQAVATGNAMTPGGLNAGGEGGGDRFRAAAPESKVGVFIHVNQDGRVVSADPRSMSPSTTVTKMDPGEMAGRD